MAALIGTTDCCCSGLAVEPDGVETVWHDEQQQSDCELSPLLLQVSLLSSETICCCQVNKKKKNLHCINPALRNLHWVYGSDFWFIKLLMVCSTHLLHLSTALCLTAAAAFSIYKTFNPFKNLPFTLEEGFHTDSITYSLLTLIHRYSNRVFTFLLTSLPVCSQLITLLPPTTTVQM